MKITSTIGPLKFTLLSGVPGSLIFPLDMNSGTIQYTYALRMKKRDSFQKAEKAEIILYSLFSHSSDRNSNPLSIRFLKLEYKTKLNPN